MLSVHFELEDYGRVVLARQVDPLSETVLAAHVLQTGETPRHLRAWRRQVTPALSPPMRPLFDLVLPGASGFPDFLTPGVDGGLEEGLAVLARTPVGVLSAEIGCLDPAAHPGGWAARLATGEPAARAELESALRAFNAVAVAPEADPVGAAFDAERSARLAILADRGLHAMLATIHARAAWRGSVLWMNPPPEVPGEGQAEGPAEGLSVRLGGRGLTVYPSRFARVPMIRDVPGEAPLLIVPARPELLDRHAGAPLADLLGRTRSRVLRSLRSPATTGELAVRVGISPASASEHAAVLRAAGLVGSTRAARTVRHHATELGRRLLD